MSIENLETYKNRNGYPIIRRCENCQHWSEQNIYGGKRAGYCKAAPLYFAFTLKKTVYPITKEFYLCESHKFENEEKLKEVSESILLIDAIKEKENIK